jgi:hypothetical protein
VKISTSLPLVFMITPKTLTMVEPCCFGNEFASPIDPVSGADSSLKYCGKVTKHFAFPNLIVHQ